MVLFGLVAIALASCTHATSRSPVQETNSIAKLGNSHPPDVAARQPAQSSQSATRLRESIASVAYDKFFPRYAEFCAINQLKRIEGRDGSISGHAVLFLKGACLDRDASYPRLKLCDLTDKQLADSEWGTGVSVNKYYNNVNWVGVQGRSVFMQGGLEDNEALTIGVQESLIQEMVNNRTFRGIQVDAAALKRLPAGATLEERLARESVGTDYAVRFGRDTYCTRMPVNAPMLQSVIDFLNEKNRSYFSGEQTFKWSFLKNNCVHLLRNALAVIGFEKSVKVDQPLWRQIFNLALPSHEAIRLARAAIRRPVGDVRKVYRDEMRRKMFLTYGQLPEEPGGLSVLSKVWSEENELYDLQGRRLLMLNKRTLVQRGSVPLRNSFSGPKHDDLQANLTSYLESYRRILATTASLDWYAKRNDFARTPAFKQFYEKYMAYIAQQANETEANLRLLLAADTALPE